VAALRYRAAARSVPGRPRIGGRVAARQDDRIDELRSRLESIAEELAELALERLREAVEAGATKPPEAEKRLTRARRAVEKAVSLLDGA
jgi:hypothetical protein